MKSSPWEQVISNQVSRPIKCQVIENKSQVIPNEVSSPIKSCPTKSKSSLKSLMTSHFMSKSRNKKIFQVSECWPLRWHSIWTFCLYSCAYIVHSKQMLNIWIYKLWGSEDLTLSYLFFWDISYQSSQQSSPKPSLLSLKPDWISCLESLV